MTFPARTDWRAPVTALVAAAAVVSCAGINVADKEKQPNAQLRPPSKPPAFQVAQLKSGPGAPFELCVVELCPKVTPKTLSRVAILPSSGAVIPLLPPESIKQQPMQQVSVAWSPAVAPQNPEPGVRQISVAFGTGSVVLTAASRRALDTAMPEARRASVIEIRGRTDDLGRSEQNDLLARDRALAVRAYLHQRKLPDHTLIRISFKGSCCYISSNDTSVGRAANRRVEIEFQRPLQLAKRSETQ